MNIRTFLAGGRLWGMGDTATLALVSTGNRYTPIDQDACYLLWRTVAGRSCREVARRVAATIGVDARTITRWAVENDWDARANEEDSDLYGASRLAAAVVIGSELVPSIETVKAIRDDPKAPHRDRLAASQYIIGLNGLAPTTRVDSVVTHTAKAEVVDQGDLRNLSPDELMLREQQARSRSRHP